jgi:hypothetical protein
MLVQLPGVASWWASASFLASHVQADVHLQQSNCMDGSSTAVNALLACSVAQLVEGVNILPCLTRAT